MATQTGIGFTQSGNGADEPVDLAHAASFHLGRVLVEPSRLRLSRPHGEAVSVEPRVMQVLVTLRLAAGSVVSRDDLIERCWSGRIVSENAINRVISLLRKVAETIGKDEFSIETIARVGYRLVSVDAPTLADASIVTSPEAADAQPAISEDRFGMWNRRRILYGLSAAGAAATLPFGVEFVRERAREFFSPHTPSAEARQYYDAGMRAQYFGIDATSEQAEIYFRRAAQADPQWADAWGSLAMSYRHMLDGNTNSTQWRLVEQTRSAANRALDLDPNNAEALVALTLIASPLGRWHEAEAEYDPMVERFPKAFVMRGHYARLLRDLGRFNDAAAHTARQAADHPLIPIVAAAHLQSLWGADRLQEADAEAERAYRLFAKNPGIWFMRAAYLTHTDRPAEAVGMAMNREGWPAQLPPFLMERRRLTAQALLTRAQADIDAAMVEITSYIDRSLAQPPHLVDPAWAVPFLVAIGDLETAFAILENYYFARGRLAPPVSPESGPLTRRESWLLFMPMTELLRADRRFAQMIDELGLIASFRATGRWPDHWRVA